jgi:serine phosphatase RsbU (regulator of sigma subunit)
MPRRKLSFKYKLALSFSTIIVGHLVAAFWLIGTLTKQYVAAAIERDLVSTCVSVARLMEARRARLEELAVAVASDYLIRTILADKGMDRVTRDDILNSIVLPSHAQLNLLAVLNTDASIRAISTKAEALEPQLIRHPAVDLSLKGRAAVGFIPRDGTFFQIAAIPVRIGIYVRELIGAVVVGMPWSMQDLKGIRDLSHAEIAFFDTTGVLISSGAPFAPQPGNENFAIAWSELAALPSDWPSQLTAGPERFVVVKIGTPDAVSPAYMVARSLDQQLEFWNRMWSWLLKLGGGGVLIGCAVSFMLALGISRPIHILQSAFRRVARGDFKHPVAVSSRDEFAELATAFNRMQAGLEERARLKQALLVAEEVQHNLLPEAPPCVEHLDIAGASIYCDAIGGDYYDYLEGPAGPGALRIALGDVCGHGTAAALLMASSRALLRSRSLQPGSIDRVVSDVNRAISLDMKDTGRFITLFLVEIDAEARRLHWVRAGHDAAILYHPATDTFENLAGPGAALGIDANQSYTAQSRSGLGDGQVLVVGTDGIWEARNAAGEMFGKDRLYSLLRRMAGGSAREIADSMLEHLKQFLGGSEFEDDVTLVVVKFKPASAPNPNPCAPSGNGQGPRADGLHRPHRG